MKPFQMELNKILDIRLRDITVQIAGSVLIKNICCEVVYIPTKMEKSIANSPLQPDMLGGVQSYFLVFFNAL